MKVWYPAGEQSHIAVYDDALSLEACSRIVKFATDNSTKVLRPGRTASGVDTMVKQSFDLPMVQTVLEERFGEFPDYLHNAEIMLSKDLGLCISLYEQKYQDVHHPYGWTDTGFNFQAYYKGKGFYRRHVDGDSVHEKDRVLAVIMYLNTVEEGGGTEFPLHGVTVDAKIGRICIFPSTWTHPHIGIMPISDDKFIISTFLKIGVEEHDHQHDADHSHDLP